MNFRKNLIQRKVPEFSNATSLIFLQKNPKIADIV